MEAQYGGETSTEAAAPADAGATSDASLAYDLEDLEKLAELRDQGILTEAEFTAKKRELLGL